MDTKSYKNGLIEAVVFCFYKDDKILLEDRGQGFNVEAFYPNGTIELKDKGHDEDYIVCALYREVDEEFHQQITILENEYLGEIVVPEMNVLFYVYLVTEWEGHFPEVIKEVGEKDSNIAFFEIEEAKQLFNYKSAFEILDYILAYIDKQKT